MHKRIRNKQLLFLAITAIFLLVFVFTYRFDSVGEFRLTNAMQDKSIQKESSLQDSTQKQPIQQEKLLLAVSEKKISSKLYYYGSGLVASKQDSVVTYYHQDYLSSVRTQSNVNKNKVSSMREAPFGEDVYDSGNVVSSSNSYKFTSQEQDESLYYYGARYYDTSTGRFTQLDPVLDIASPYRYTDNNPLKFIDPTGAKTVDKNVRNDPEYVRYNLEFGNKRVFAALSTSVNKGLFTPDIETVRKNLARIPHGEVLVAQYDKMLERGKISFHEGHQLFLSNVEGKYAYGRIDMFIPPRSTAENKPYFRVAHASEKIAHELTHAVYANANRGDSLSVEFIRFWKEASHAPDTNTIEEFFTDRENEQIAWAVMESMRDSLGTRPIDNSDTFLPINPVTHPLEFEDAFNNEYNMFARIKNTITSSKFHEEFTRLLEQAPGGGRSGTF